MTGGGLSGTRQNPHVGFSDKFYHNVSATGHAADAARAPSDSADAGQAAPVYYSQEKYGDLALFKTHPDYAACKQEFTDACRALLDHAERFNLHTYETVRPHVEDFIDTLETRRSHETDHILYDNGKRALETIVAQLDNDALPADLRKRTLVDTCKNLRVCTEGVTSYLTMGAQTLAMSAHGQAGEIQDIKQQLVDAHTLDFLYAKHPALMTSRSGMLVHFRNAYRNHISALVGIDKQPDQYVSALRREDISQADLDEYAEYIQTRLTPDKVATALAEQQLDRCADIMDRHLGPGQRTVSLEDYGAPVRDAQGQEQRNPLQQEMEDEIDAVRQKYGCQYENILAWDMDEECDERFTLASDPTMLAASVLEGMARDGFVEAEYQPAAVASHTPLPGAPGPGGAPPPAETSTIKAVGGLAWVEDSQGVKSPLDIHHPAVTRIDVDKHPGAIVSLLEKSAPEDIRKVFPDASALANHPDVVEALAKRMNPQQLEAYLRTGQEPVQDGARLSFRQKFCRALNNFVGRRLFRVSPRTADVLLKFVGRDVINVQDARTGDSLLHQAARRGDLAMARVLLKHGIDPGLRNAEGQNAFLLALRSSPSVDFAYAIASPKQVRSLAFREDSLIRVANQWARLASLNRDPEVFRTLLQSGIIDVDTHTEKGFALVAGAIENPNPAVFNLLAEAGADLGVTAGDGTNLLHFMSADTDPAVAQRLLDAGLDVNTRGPGGHTSLHHAAKRGVPPAILQKLIDAGADVNARNDADNTCLHLAATNPLTAPAALKALIDAGVDVNARNERNQSCLHVAAMQRATAPATIRTLIDAGADVNARDINQNTPLHMAAARTRKHEVIGDLLAAGADPLLQSASGLTPAHLACHENLSDDSIKIIDMFVRIEEDSDSGGAHPFSVFDNQGKLPVDYARENSNLMYTREGRKCIARVAWRTMDVR